MKIGRNCAGHGGVAHRDRPAWADLKVPYGAGYSGKIPGYLVLSGKEKAARMPSSEL